jgi:phenylpyruvate tautomerase PptA (4-oxalocrotonate tautomerase family)
MPVVNISMRAGRPPAIKKAIADAIHTALVEAFQIPDWDRNHRFFEFTEENFEIPENKMPAYTIIELAVYSGRSLDAKRKLYQGIIQKMSALGFQPTDIVIILQEPPLENWGIRGGFPASEVDIGFKINV